MKFVKLIVILSVLLGCTVTKRVHLPGYHVEWRKSEKKFSSQTNFEFEKANNEQGLTKTISSTTPTPIKNLKLDHMDESTEAPIQSIQTTIRNIHTLQSENTNKKPKVNHTKLNRKAPFLLYIKDPEFMKKAGLVLVLIGAFLILSLFFANLQLFSFNNITIGNGGCLVYIGYLILAGIGYLMILAFGLTTAFIIGLSFMFIGIVIAGIAIFILKRRR